VVNFTHKVISVQTQTKKLIHKHIAKLFIAPFSCWTQFHNDDLVYKHNYSIDNQWHVVLISNHWTIACYHLIN